MLVFKAQHYNILKLLLVCSCIRICKLDLDLKLFIEETCRKLYLIVALTVVMTNKCCYCAIKTEIIRILILIYVQKETWYIKLYF